MPAERGAISADGSELDVVGKGVISFVTRGRRFANVPVRMMRNLTCGWLIGRRWTPQVGLVLDFGKGRGHFEVPCAKGLLKFSGTVTRSKKCQSEHVSAIHEADVPEAVAGLELSEFGTPCEQESLRALLLEYQDLFLERTSTVPGYEFSLELLPDADLARLDRPSFRKSRVERELEAEKVRELVGRGILVPSTALRETNNIMVPKKMNAGSIGGMRVTSDFRALSSLTQDIS